MLVVRKTKRYMTFLSLVLVFVVILSTEARAELFGFSAISNNSSVSGLLAGQFCLDVTGNNDEVFFTFYNNYNPETASAFNDPPVESIVTAAYFADGSLFVEGSGHVDANGPGVSFSDGASPPDFPHPEPDVWTTFFAADSDPSVHNGVNEWLPPPPWEDPEYVTIRFSLLTLTTFDDVLYGIRNPYSADGLLIGIHVQSIEGDESDWFVTPVPGAAILGMLGLGVAGLKLRRFT